jgi:hypothetical protein
MRKGGKVDKIVSGNGNNQLRVKLHKANAIKHLDLMHEAIEAGDYKKAMHHKIIANVAIDEMVSVSDLVENNS